MPEIRAFDIITSFQKWVTEEIEKDGRMVQVLAQRRQDPGNGPKDVIRLTVLAAKLATHIATLTDVCERLVTTFEQATRYEINKTLDELIAEKAPIDLIDVLKELADAGNDR